MRIILNLDKANTKIYKQARQDSGIICSDEDFICLAIGLLVEMVDAKKKGHRFIIIDPVAQKPVKEVRLPDTLSPLPAEKDKDVK